MKYCVDLLGYEIDQCLALLQLFAITVVPILVVFVTVIWTRRVSRNRATLDTLLIEQSNPDLNSQSMDFAKLCIKYKKNLAQWASPRKNNSKEAKLIHTILNRFELVAIGVHRGSIDGNTYKAWKRTILVKYWIHCIPFVIMIREIHDNKKLFCEFEKLARAWATNEEISEIWDIYNKLEYSG